MAGNRFIQKEQIDKVILAIEAGTCVRIENMEVEAIPLVEHKYRFGTR